MHTIRSRWRTDFAGETKDGQQALLGWHSEFVAVLLFDAAGDLLETKQYPLGIDLKKGLGPAVEAIADKKIEDIRRELGFKGKAIRVQPFSVEKWQIRLKLLPLDLEDFLAHPDQFPPEDAEIFRADLEKWKADQNCVLEWGNSYCLDKNGRTI